MLLQDLQEHVGAAPSEEQLDQLSEVIARSQRSFKELIDSFEDAACAVSLDGTLRTVNKSVSELLNLPYTAIVGQKFFDFLEEPTRGGVEAGLVRFVEKRHWAGTVRVRFKNNSRPLFFDCVLNAIVKGGEVVGVSVLDGCDRAARERTPVHRTLRDSTGRRLLQLAGGQAARR